MESNTLRTHTKTDRIRKRQAHNKRYQTQFNGDRSSSSSTKTIREKTEAKENSMKHSNSGYYEFCYALIPYYTLLPPYYALLPHYALLTPYYALLPYFVLLPP